MLPVTLPLNVVAVNTPVTTAPVGLACTFTLPPESLSAVASIPVRFAPLPLNDVAVTIPVTSIPCEFAVTAEPTTI